MNLHVCEEYPYLKYVRKRGRIQGAFLGAGQDNRISLKDQKQLINSKNRLLYPEA